MKHCSVRGTPWLPGPRWRVAEPAGGRASVAGPEAASPSSPPGPSGHALEYHKESSAWGLSLADLERVMPRLIPEATLTRPAGHYLLSWPDGRSVTLDPGTPRERLLAGLRIPWLQLDFEFRGLNAGDRAAFLARFARCFQKGGG